MRSSAIICELFYYPGVKQNDQKMTSEELMGMVNDDDLIIVDIRDEENYHDDHIPNARHLSLSSLSHFCQETDQKQCIVVYCYHGVTSQSVVDMLFSQGFESVYSLQGGFEGWKSLNKA